MTHRSGDELLISGLFSVISLINNFSKTCAPFSFHQVKNKFEHDVASHSLSLSVALEVGPWFWLDWCMSACTLTIFKNGDVEPAASELPAALTKKQMKMINGAGLM